MQFCDFATRGEQDLYQCCTRLLAAGGSPPLLPPEDVLATSIVLLGETLVCWCTEAGASVPEVLTLVRTWLPYSLTAYHQGPTRALAPPPAWADAVDHAAPGDMPPPGQDARYRALRRVWTEAGQAGLTVDAAFRVALALLADAMMTVYSDGTQMRLEAVWGQIDATVRLVERYLWERLSAGA